MSVQIDASGNRWVQAEVEVPGTPEEVWEAIATGPGISSWFVPTQVDGRVGGSVTANFGPGMDSVSRITEWAPPRRFAADSDDMGPGAPTVATEWIVEARGGGSCTVRVVHRWFAESDDWDEQFAGIENGWPAFFRILQRHLTHFRGQAANAVQVMAVAPEPKEAAWAALTNALGITRATVGQRVETAPGAPRLAGVVEWAGQPAWPEDLLIRLEEPAPGFAHLVPHAMGGQIYLTIRLNLYGDADGVESTWQAWLNERFAPVAV
jgi:uncharacterized protein YndB with AHSA1/START domain